MAQLSGDTDQGGPAVYGNNTYPTTEIDAWGGYFESTAGEGVRGLSHTVHGAVVGINDNSGPYADPPGPGGFFTSGLGEGVHGECSAEHGAVVGVNHGALRAGGPGGYFLGQTGDGVQGWSESQGHAGVRAVNEHGGPGLHATGALAALFEGDVVVTGDIKLAGADLAEGFRNRGDAVAPGSVMVLVGEDEVVAGDTAYDRRAVGVVSGAEGYRPAVVLGNDGRKASKKLRNYPDPMEMFAQYGSDAVRWTLMGSPVLRGGNLVVAEESIRESVRQVLLPLWKSKVPVPEAGTKFNVP